MEANDEKMFLENIEEFVMDEGKIVTYKWLSATLDLHVNTAKQLLYTYAMPNNKRKDGIYITYLLAGELADGSGKKIQIVRENDLNPVKSKFKFLTSEHVYSVQKASRLPDLNILYSVDNLENEKHNEVRLGPIRCSKAVCKPENNIKSLQIKARAPTTVVDNPISSSKKGTNVSSSDKVGSEPVTVGLALPQSSKTIESELSKPVESKSSNGSSIASLFTAQSKVGKNNNSKAVAASSNNKPESKNSKGSGIAMFFTKQSEKQPINTEHKETLQDSKAIAKEDSRPIDEITHAAETAISVDKKELESTKEKTNIKVDVDEAEKTTTKSDIMKQKKGKTSQKVGTVVTKEKKENTSQKLEMNGKQSSSSGKGKKKKSSENSQPAKKRKRIMVISDDSASSEEDIFGSDSDTEIQPPSPEILPEAPPKSYSSDEDIIPSTPISQQIRNGKMRKRKLVNKTFEDKDGFIMTKKEYVFGSCSEDDVDSDKQVCTDQVPVIGDDDKTDKFSAEINEGEDVEKDGPSKKQAKGEKQTRKKKASPPVGQKSKQSTLMNFFNKN